MRRLRSGSGLVKDRYGSKPPVSRDQLNDGSSVLSQKFALIQRDQKRFWPRRASEGLAIANANERNTGPGTFLTRPEGAPRMRHCDVAKLDKGLPLPAPRALHCHIRDALN
jgi:hypothetical protein